AGSRTISSSRSSVQQLTSGGPQCTHRAVVGTANRVCVCLLRDQCFHRGRRQ
ncbi:hypothetical protein NDU88_001486, partial [Pleurodeles waltl]